MIQFDSPLRRLPAGLDRRQTIIFDGIRHAAEIAQLADDRLRRTLTEIAIRDDSVLITSAYLDAWAMVDSIDRLRTLVALVPVKEGHEGEGAALMAKLQGIRSLRNVSDHLAQRIDYVVATSAPALGRLRWFTMTDDATMRGVSCVLVPGTLASGRDIAVVSPAGRNFRAPTDLVYLSAGAHDADLGEALSTAEALVRTVERGIAHAIAKHGLEGSHIGADLTIRLDVTLHDLAP